MKGEIWKDIEGYEGLYQISNMGRVKSLESKWWRWWHRIKRSIGGERMNEKDISNVVNRLIEATDKLDRLTNTFSKNINRMIICIITMLLILAVFVIVILI